MGPHEVRSCTICELELDPKKVTGTGGVAMTFSEALLPAQVSYKHELDEHVATSAFETARAHNSLDPIKSLCLSPILPSCLCCLFLLCVIHIHSSTTLLPPLPISQHPTMHFARELPGRCFRAAEPCAFCCRAVS